MSYGREPKKAFVARSAPYALGQMARTYHASVAVNPYGILSDRDLAVAAPGMTWEEAAMEFERGWNYEGGEPAGGANEN